MAIRPTQLRAGFILLLFTLLFIASNSLVTEVYADSPEESFKVTPLPFWDIDNVNNVIEYGTNTQDVLFRSGEFFDNFYQIGDWAEYGISAEDSVSIDNENDLLVIEAFGNNDNDYDGVLQDLDLSGSYVYSYEIKFRQNLTSVQYDLTYLSIYDDTGTITGEDHIHLENVGGANEWLVYNDIFPYDNIDNVYIRPRVDAGQQLKFEVEYLSFVKLELSYEEGMSDIGEWVLLNGVEAPTASGGFLSYYVVGDWAYDAIRSNEIGLSDNQVDYIAIRYKSNVSSDIQFRILLYSEDTSGGDVDTTFGTLSVTTSWQLTGVFLPLEFGLESIVFYSRSHTNVEVLIDFLVVGSFAGIFNTSIPIERFTNHKLEFMIDTENLAETTKLDFGIFQDNKSMNYDFSLENQTFTQRDFEFDYSEYNYLRFILDLKYSTNYFKLSCYDENNTKIFGNIIFEQVRKLGNNFKIQSDNLGGWFYLYYFTGNVDYSTVWTETIIKQDPNIENYLLSASALDDNILVDHEIIYNRFISNFQFFRTNIFEYTAFSTNFAQKVGVMIDIQFFYPNGIDFYRVNGDLGRTYNSLFFYMKVFETVNSIELEIYSSACESDLGTLEIEGNIQFGVWRTQDNKLGTFYNQDEVNFVDIIGIPRFMSNKTFENFQANITITYYSEAIASGYRNFLIELDGFELGYGRVEGVAEPHFSTTWWDSIPFLGPIINAFMLVGNAIILALELGLSPITIFLDSIFGAIGGIAGTVWVLFESALSDLGISIDALASDVFGFFDSILTSISDIIDDVYSAIINLNDNFVAWVIDGITDALIPALVAGIDSLMDTLFALWEYQLNLVGTALGWGDIGTFLFDFTDSVVLTIPSWLEFIISVNIMMIDIFIFVNALYAEYGPTFILYGTLFIAIDILTAIMTLDLDIIGDCLIKYIKVIAFIAEFMLSIISTVLNAIWGLLPF